MKGTIHMTTKICTKCGEKKPATAEYFYKAKDNKDGLRGQCKVCEKERDKQYKQKNTDKIKQYRTENADKIKQYFKENAGKIKEQRKQYYEENKGEILGKQKQYRKENTEEIKKRKKKYYEENTEEIKEYWKQHYRDNAERKQEYVKQYRKENTDKVKHYAVRYSQKRRAKARAVPATLTIEQWEQIKEEFDNRCAYCGKKKKLTQEHFVPLSKGGEYTHNNIIPACKSCNCSKQDKEFFDWYPEQEFYNEHREQKILNHLEYDTDSQTQQLTLINA